MQCPVTRPAPHPVTRRTAPGPEGRVNSSGRRPARQKSHDAMFCLQPAGPGQLQRAEARKAKIARCDVLPAASGAGSTPAGGGPQGKNRTMRCFACSQTAAPESPIKRAGRREAVRVPRAGVGGQRSPEGGAQTPPSKRRAGCPKRTSGDGARAASRRGESQSTVRDRRSRGRSSGRRPARQNRTMRCFACSQPFCLKPAAAPVRRAA
jgi:hypothetical protein